MQLGLGTNYNWSPCLYLWLWISGQLGRMASRHGTSTAFASPKFPSPKWQQGAQHGAHAKPDYAIYDIYIIYIYIYISLSLSPSPSPRVLAICVCYFHFKCFLWISRGPTGCPRGARGQATARCRVNIGDGLTARLLCPGGHLRDEVPLTKRLQHVTIIEGFICQWIGLRENLQETMVFTIKYRAFL